MKRNVFRNPRLTVSLLAGLLAGSALTADDRPWQDPSRHRLPATDREYVRTSGYVEETPVPEYRWAPESAYEQFNDMKFGVRIHWGIYSLYGSTKESWNYLRMPPAEKHAYNQQYKTWNPAGFDADAWMDFFAASGMKMFAFTTKHHDGFSLFDTKARVKRRVNYAAPAEPVLEDCDLAYSIMEGPFKRDIVRELCDAARQRDIKIDLYFSNPDWYDADFRPHVWHPVQIPSWSTQAVVGKDRQPEGPPGTRHGERGGTVMAPDPTQEEIDRMVQRHRTQLTELLTNYGKIDMVCLDMWLGPASWPQIRETMMALRKIQPDVMFRARGIGNYGDYYTPEGFVPGSKENTEVPWFVIYPLGENFSYEPDPAKHKGSKWVITNIVDSAAKGGNFMVGIGPDGNGTFHPTAIEQLKLVGEWLKVNGRGIYATRARDGDKWKEGENIRYTRTKDRRVIYAHALEWPGEQLVLETVTPKAQSKIFLLGHDQPLSWKIDEQKRLVIETPAAAQQSIPEKLRLAYSFAIDSD
jgi:alpha-L-fucosidase